MSLIKEFKAFAMRGNVVDMAVGVIIGGAFGKIVNSLVNDIIMPPIGMLLQNVDFSKLSVILMHERIDPTGKTIPSVTLNYGMFVNTIVNFIIIAIAVFILIKGINAAKHREIQQAQITPPPPPPELSAEVKLLAEIRDLLKSKPT